MIGIDIETTALDPADGEISLIQVYDPDANKVTIYDVLGGGRVSSGPEWRFNGDGSRERIATPQRLEGIAHNATFDEAWLTAEGYDVAPLDDTMIASLVFYTGTNAAKNRQFSHSLGAVVSRELKHDFAKDEQKSDWSVRPLTRSQLEYAARDAIVLPALFDRLMEKVEKVGLRDVYDLEKRVSRVVDAMERAGFAVNEEKLEPLVEHVTSEAERLKDELSEEWGGINPGSSKQLREYFALDEREDWPTTPAGAPSTNQDAMKLLLEDEPSVQKWIDWKTVEKLRSTYGKSLQEKIVNGRIHARFKSFGAATGRFSSSSPNLQNIPKDERYRSIFWSGGDDKRLITADYSGIELWLAAVLWDEKHMKRLIADGVNLHSATGASIYGIPREKVVKGTKERAVGKTTNFALLYGAGPKRLRQQLASDKDKPIYISDDEAYEIFIRFLDTYPAFSAKRREMKTGFEAGKIKGARTPIGRRRVDTVDWYGPLMNHQIQGTGADGLKYAMARIHEQNPFPSLRLVCTVHDELVYECDTDVADEAAEWVSEQMTEGMIEAVRMPREELPSLPFAETSVSRDWS